MKEKVIEIKNKHTKTILEFHESIEKNLIFGKILSPPLLI